MIRKLQITLLLLLTVGAVALLAQVRKFKPGFNLFSIEQDIQLGKEAAAEIEKQVQVLNDPVLQEYVNQLGRQLAAQPEAGQFPYTFKVVLDNAINAFALPGGPTYVNSGLIRAAANEGQLVGVMAHEIAHVALRHGTNQASKANLIQLPAVLAGAAGGNGMLGQLGRVGVGLGLNGVLMKFSRGAETQADLHGAQMMAGAGWNPIEMARFFETLEAQGGARGPEFLSSHPNPGNRRQAIEQQLRSMQQRPYNADTGRFRAMQDRVAQFPVPQQPQRRTR